MINEKKIIDVIEAEQNLIIGGLVEEKLNHPGGTYVLCKSPGHCAIGALLFAAGMTNEELMHVDPLPLFWNHPVREERTSPNRRAKQLLEKEYGLSVEQAAKIVGANDNISTGAPNEFRRRQQRVIEYVRALARLERETNVPSREVIHA